MKRTGRRFTEDFLEENEEEIVYEDFELQSEKADESEYQYFDFSNEDFSQEPLSQEVFSQNSLSQEVEETEEEAEEKKSSSVLKKIAKVLIVILVLIALFFISAKTTEFILDYNEDPATFGNEVPDYDEDIKDIVVDEDSIITEEIPEILGDEEIPDNVQQEDATEEPSEEPSEENTEEKDNEAKPDPEPEPEPTPSPAPKPSITPGNPAS